MDPLCSAHTTDSLTTPFSSHHTHQKPTHLHLSLAYVCTHLMKHPFSKNESADELTLP